MKHSDGPAWILRIQNALLPLAKGIYLLAAIGSLLAVIGGSLFALYLQSVISRSPTNVPIPPPYSKSPASLAERAIDLSVVDKRLTPPTNITFKVTIGTITAPLREEDNVVLGYFLADTANGLAPADGISVQEGRDAALFERTFDQKHREIGLRPTAALINEINDTLRDIHEEQERNFEIKVVARDRYKLRSDATNIYFPLRFGPRSSPPQTPEPPKAEPTELEKIAGDIAKIVTPDATPARAVAYRRALEIFRQCGAGEQNPVLVASYRQAFEQVRARLTADNIEAFYTGLCEAWRNTLAQEAAARRQAEEARAQAVAFNNEAYAKHQLEALAAKATAPVTMTVVGGALATFLSISLIVAFLAIEGHSRAIRRAVEAMVKVSQDTK